MALLTFSLFCFVLYCYAFVQYCNVNTIQYNAMHKFVRVLDNPPKNGDKIPGVVLNEVFIVGILCQGQGFSAAQVLPRLSSPGLT